MPANWALPPGVDAAVLCAAITSEAACWEQTRLAHRVNVEATLAIAQTLAEAGAFVLFLSSNLVFGGGGQFRGAGEPPDPVTLYGTLKAEAEAGIQTLGSHAAIVRLTKVIGPEAPLIRGWIEALTRGGTVRPFYDMVFSPLSLRFVTEALDRLAVRRASGIMQLSGAADISYAEAALHITRRLGVPEHRVQPVSRREAGISDASAPPHTTLAMGLQFESRLFDGLNATADKREGMTAFVEKRKGGWSGS